MPIRSIPRAVSLALVLLTLVSGCFDARPAPSSPAAPPEIVIDYERTGGIAGLDDRVVIFDNGLTLISGRDVSTEIALDSPEIERIQAVFTRAGFGSLEGNYSSRRSGADVLQYRISYRGKTVIAEETVIPSSLGPVIDEMDRIISLGRTENSAVPLPTIGS